MKITVGQKLWFVSSERRWPRDGFVCVTKVGRKWATLDNGERIDVETLIADGRNYTSHGTAYRSRKDYEDAAHLQKCWHRVAESFRGRWIVPPHITQIDVDMVAKTLGVLLPDKPKGEE